MRCARNLLLGGALSLSLAACGGPMKYQVHGAPLVPGMDATIETKLDEVAFLTRIDITLEHTAPPSRLAPGANTYVAWGRADRYDQWIRLGALTYDEGNREAKLKGVTVPLTAFELIVTVEDNPAPPTPSSRILFTQLIGNK